VGPPRHSTTVTASLGGREYTQVAQYRLLIMAYLIPAIFISLLMTGHVVPQIGLGRELADGASRVRDARGAVRGARL
ncbi:MAG TPA: hypothetical protein VNL96_02240, partial [Gemmatimonadaceae bacterium]|nr:hypothetical protein [Gemmatimonadaceae bacterium]